MATFWDDRLWKETLIGLNGMAVIINSSQPFWPNDPLVKNRPQLDFKIAFVIMTPGTLIE